ncbi:hypothetical protein, partial [Neisseria gonorrhoeae]|uniref:hypothetical protein n=1 Tax=Neisseria gonorrhoeae TaxID=485 RepID=UPI0027D9815C
AALRCCLKVSSAEDRFSGIFILSIGGKKGGGWFGGQIPLSDGIQEQIARFIQTLWDCKLMPSVKSGSVDELCESVRDDI